MMALDNIIVECPCVILPEAHQLAEELSLSVAIQSAEYSDEQLWMHSTTFMYSL